MGQVNLISCLLPDPAEVRLDTWGTEPAPPTITLALTSRSRPAPCPLSGRRARRIHSWHECALADLPWGEHAVAVQLRIRTSSATTPSANAVFLPNACPVSRRPGRAKRHGCPTGLRPWALHSAARPVRAWAAAWGWPRAGILCCAWSGEHPCRWTPRRQRWAWTTGRCASGTPTARCWWTSTATARRRCFLTAKPKRLRPGRANTPALRRFPAIAPAPVPRVAAPERPTRCKWLTASTYCRTWPRHWNWRSPALPGNYAMQTRPGAGMRRPKAA